METVTDALKATGKATAREIATRLGIEVRDALEMLREQQEAGVVEFLNGYWSLSGVTTKTTEYQTLETETPTVVKIGETQMLEAIKKTGPADRRRTGHNVRHHVPQSDLHTGDGNRERPAHPRVSERQILLQPAGIGFSTSARTGSGVCAGHRQYRSCGNCHGRNRTGA